MQQCGDCLKVYDESEYTQCPFCDEEENDEGDCPECNGTRKEECYVCEGERVTNYRRHHRNHRRFIENNNPHTADGGVGIVG